MIFGINLVIPITPHSESAAGSNVKYALLCVRASPKKTVHDMEGEVEDAMEKEPCSPQ